MDELKQPTPLETAPEIGGLAARTAAALIAGRKLSSEELVRGYLERIAERESIIHAWAHIDPDAVLREARSRDNSPVMGPLHGVPIGVKDVIDVAGMPTGMGSPIYTGFEAMSDAACIAALRASGAVILGKTVTAEFAGVFPGPTRNPHRLGHTPGGSSSGSAAAVADGMTPLALGTQTGGSVLRPASFCGVVGFKPTFGTISRQGMKLAAESFDTIGVMARNVDDVRLAWGVLAGAGARVPFGRLPKSPRLKLFRGPNWHQAAPAASLVLSQTCEGLAAMGWQIDESPVPAGFEALAQARVVVNSYERARALAWENHNHAESISAAMRSVLDMGNRLTYEEYIEALRAIERWRVWFDLAVEDCDGLITLTVQGEAPESLDATGSAAFQEIWTMLHAPAITLPLGAGESGLPVGIQLIGGRYRDAELLALAESAMNSLVT